MSDESGFIRTLRAKPDDKTTYLVWADFMDEQGDPAGAALLRLWGNGTCKLKPHLDERSGWRWERSKMPWLMNAWATDYVPHRLFDLLRGLRDGSYFYYEQKIDAELAMLDAWREYVKTSEIGLADELAKVTVESSPAVKETPTGVMGAVGRFFLTVLGAG